MFSLQEFEYISNVSMAADTIELSEQYASNY